MTDREPLRATVLVLRGGMLHVVGVLGVVSLRRSAVIAVFPCLLLAACSLLVDPDALTSETLAPGAVEDAGAAIDPGDEASTRDSRFVGGSTIGPTGFAGDVEVSLPDGVRTGDLLIAHLAYRYESPTFSLAAGWSERSYVLRDCEPHKWTFRTLVSTQGPDAGSTVVPGSLRGAQGGSTNATLVLVAYRGVALEAFQLVHADTEPVAAPSLAFEGGPRNVLVGFANSGLDGGFWSAPGATTLLGSAGEVALFGGTALAGETGSRISVPSKPAACGVAFTAILRPE